MDRSVIARFHKWRLKNLSHRAFIYILSIVVGIIAGLAAIIIKNSTHFIHELLERPHIWEEFNFLYIGYPVVGIAIVLLIVKFIFRQPLSHGVPNVLYSISKRKGHVRGHNMYSSAITSIFTVGFGGSVGLEGPTVVTGAAIGSQLGRLMRLEYPQIILMVGCATGAAVAAIFKAPITGILFAVEVIMIDLTTFSLIPLLLSSGTAVLISYFFLGQAVEYNFQLQAGFKLNELGFFIFLGIFAGLISVYFTKVYLKLDKFFEQIKSPVKRLALGGLGLGALIFILPPLYGEGYEIVNACLAGNFDAFFEKGLFSNLQESIPMVILFLVAIVLFKVVASSFTFGAGGVGGVFAPSMFVGATAGLLYALAINYFGLGNIIPSNYALAGMTGLMAGVLHAPLTGIFMIAELTGGYKLFVPLMIVSTFAYLTVKLFLPHSLYNVELAKKKELITHDKDKAVLSLLAVKELLETNFTTVSGDATLRDLTRAISKSHRNIFPVVDEDNTLLGMVKMDDIRHLIFKQDLYDTVMVRDLMYMPEHFISPQDSMEVVAEKFQECGRYNLAVIDDGKYVGFISRARVFSVYRKMVSDFSHD